jgi:hypothetical protein
MVVWDAGKALAALLLVSKKKLLIYPTGSNAGPLTLYVKKMQKKTVICRKRHRKRINFSQDAAGLPEIFIHCKKMQKGKSTQICGFVESPETLCTRTWSCLHLLAVHFLLFPRKYKCLLG